MKKFLFEDFSNHINNNDSISNHKDMSQKTYEMGYEEGTHVTKQAIQDELLHKNNIILNGICEQLSDLNKSLTKIQDKIMTSHAKCCMEIIQLCFPFMVSNYSQKEILNFLENNLVKLLSRDIIITCHPVHQNIQESIQSQYDTFNITFHFDEDIEVSTVIVNAENGGMSRNIDDVINNMHKFFHLNHE